MAVERPDWEWYQRASGQIAAGQLEAAEQTIADALAAGHLWRVSLLAAPSLEPLRGRAPFEATAAEARRRVAARALRPLVLTAAPANRDGNAPLLLTLHGATGNASVELEHWRSATELGYVVAAGQSSQPSTLDGFCWDPPRERIWQDLRAIANHLPPHGRLVMAGFSQGAWVALNAALHADLFAAATVVMVAPFGGPPENLEPAARRLRIAVLVGAEDPYRAGVEHLADALGQRGHHVFFEIVPNLAHAYPADFASRLPALLESLVRPSTPRREDLPPSSPAAPRA